MKVRNLTIVKHHGELTKTGQVEPLPQAIVDEFQVQSRSQAIRATQEEPDNKNSEREVGYFLRAKEAQSGPPIEKKSHKERLTTTKTHLDVLEVSLEEPYLG